MLIDFSETVRIFKIHLDKYINNQDDFNLQVQTGTIESLLIYISNIITMTVGLNKCMPELYKSNEIIIPLRISFESFLNIFTTIPQMRSYKKEKTIQCHF